MRNAIFLGLLFASLAGCGAAPSSSAPGRGAGFEPRSDSAASSDTAPTVPLSAIASGAQANQRKITYRATLWLTVKDFGATEVGIGALVKKSGGYIAHFREDRSSGNLRGGEWVLRVPVERFDAVLEGASRLGVPQKREVTAEDVTEEYVDLSARLKSKQGIEARLLELVKTKAGEVKDIVAVETELGRVREEIERIEGRLRFLADRVALTTITIHAHEQRGYRPEQATLAGKIASTFWTSIDGIRVLAEGTLLAAVAIGPWALLLIMVVLPLAMVVRRFTRRPISPG